MHRFNPEDTYRVIVATMMAKKGRALRNLVQILILLFENFVEN
jgi:hypothetical protein